ncbi:hypothetical protein TraAM80_05769 [Trypanosoma rangeli]|uniref:Uncharacterized protein n=1 Tax=Trypanosoma rangeli TaxID=5698 RepID=A0A422ND85_TRYRA|nr:uncharacterized protein TraAM80_05769 [Trypanosoma rangeli]RNF03406.1 hypothetical protein TraAM80_05769 [Trypanosoma rangeli]|eukprot:RNF03406.1 hypothetical protein TraAM80_05769 [Trypanosoma rangeli]
MTKNVEEALRRPMLVYSKDSEVCGTRGEDLSVAGVQLPEYDAQVGDDVVYRSVHYIQGSTRASHTLPVTSATGNAAATSASASAAAAGPVGTVGSQTAPGTAHTLLAKDAAVEEEALSYFSCMPARGASVIHGMVKCRAVTSLNNCVPYAGHMESECARKMMLALGPVHILRDVAQTSFPLRFTTVKKAHVSALVCGAA